jgi:transcriptional regulator with XRE-family HTH domain
MRDQKGTTAKGPVADQVRSNIKLVRKARGLSAQQLADRCEHLERSAIAKIELGLRGITVDDLVELGRALDVKPTDLLRPITVGVMITVDET